ncbi:MAG: winged helix DNA-binding domain-containing protein [Polyangiales bacterium]
MPLASLPRTRLASQLLARPSAATPHAVVAAMGALQAQEYGSMAWAIGARLATGTLAHVEAAIEGGLLVRSWPLRGTMHVVAAEDLAWMMRLTAPAALARTATRRAQHGLTADVLKRGEKVVRKALDGGARLTRTEVEARLAQAGLTLSSHAVQHLLFYLALHDLVCLGPRRGRDGTFVLREAWAPRQRALQGDEALGTLATRFLHTRAPARAEDFAWWTGLTLGRAREALALAESIEPAAPAPAGTAHLLPGWDEYILSYKERTQILAPERATAIVPGGNGIFLPMLVVDGKVVGTWKRTLTKRAVRVTLAPFDALGTRALRAVSHAAERYGDFLERSVELS